MPSNKSSASDTGFSVDRFRAVAWEQWVSTLLKIEQVNIDIVHLAEAEAQRQYQEMTRAPFEIRRAIWTANFIKKWATWQALSHVCMNAAMGRQGNECLCRRR